jgi:hypothetical protein
MVWCLYCYLVHGPTVLDSNLSRGKCIKSKLNFNEQHETTAQYLSIVCFENIQIQIIKMLLSGESFPSFLSQS